MLRDDVEGNCDHLPDDGSAKTSNEGTDHQIVDVELPGKQMTNALVRTNIENPREHLRKRQISVCLSVPPDRPEAQSARPEGHPARLEVQPARHEAQPARYEG